MCATHHYVYVRLHLHKHTYLTANITVCLSIYIDMYISDRESVSIYFLRIVLFYTYLMPLY